MRIEGRYSPLLEMWELAKNSQRSKMSRNSKIRSKLDVSPNFWNIITQALTGQSVCVPQGTPKNLILQLQVLIKNQSDIGWDNFILGRVTFQWENIAFQKDKKKKTQETTAFEKIWQAIFRYVAELWQVRCEFVAEVSEREEQRTLDEQITILKEYDFTVLPRSDRLLFDTKNVPDINSTPAHKKCWIFNTQCAIEKQTYMLDPDQQTLYEYGFAISDPR